MTKLIGQQQFSQLWNQFQSTNSHLFQGGGQLKSNLSTGDVQQLLTTVTQDKPDDAQLYGAHRLMTEHADAFQADDLELFQLELDEREIDFAQFMIADETAGLANAAKRFAKKVLSKKEAFVIKSDPGKAWDLKSEEGILEAIAAIADQDKELFPGNDAAEAVGTMSAGDRFVKRRYRLGMEEFLLGRLLNRIGKAAGIRGRAKVVAEVKRRLGHVEQPSADVVITAADGTEWDFHSVEGVLAIFRAIVEQDGELFPGDDVAQKAGRMKTSPRFQQRRYRFGEKTIKFGSMLANLCTKIGTTRPALAIEKIQEALGHKPQLLRIKAAPNAQWDFATPEGILECIRVIVAQDKEFYPGDDVSKAVGAMTTTPRFTRRRYQFGTKRITLFTLLNNFRTMTGIAKPAATVAEVQRRLGCTLPQATTMRIEAPPGMRWDFDSQDGLLEAIKAILTQDKEQYPFDNIAAAVRTMNTDKPFTHRRYLFGYKKYTMQTLLLKFGRTIGLKTMVPVIAELKRRLGNVRFTTEEEISSLISEHNLDPLFALLSEAPLHLRSFLEIFYGDELNEVAATHMVRTFSGLGLYSEIHQPRSPERDLDILVRAMLMRQDRLAHLNERDHARAIRILSYVFGEVFNRDIGAAEKHLAKLSAGVADPTIKRLLVDLVAHYRAGTIFSTSGLKTKPFIYQKLGAQFLVENDRAILADATGLGKTLTALAAAERLREDGKIKKVLVITPAGVKSTWADEIAKHLVPDSHRKVVRIQGDASEKRDQIMDTYDADYVIANFAFLRNKTQEDLQPLLANLDLVIVDEAQNMSNPSPKVLQAEAVRRIRVPRRWLLTATPYYSRPEYIFSLLAYLHPDRYSDLAVFRKAFTTDLDGLRLLHGELEGVMLRRRLAETLGEYQLGVPLEAQGVRFPRKERISPAQEGYYDLSRGQVEFLRELSQDIRGWMVRKGYSKKMHHFAHLRVLYAAVVDPALIGEDISSPMYEELDRIVMKRLAAGKKILIYGHHRAVIERIVKSYAHLGAVKYNSSVSYEDREKNLQAFENDPRIPILVAGITSGGVGLNIKAADTVIYTERSFMHSAKIQSEGRPQRINVERPKASYEVITLVGRYPEELVKEEGDPSFRAFMEQGTVNEILEERLEGLDRIYRLVLDGFKSGKEAQREAMKLVIQGFSGLSKVALGELDSASKRKAAASAGAFYRVWNEHREDGDVRNCIERIAKMYLGVDADPSRLAAALEDVNGITADDLEWLATPFSEPNKYLRATAAEVLPVLLRELSKAGMKVSKAAGSLAERNSKVARVVLPLMAALKPWKDEGVASIIKALLAEINELSSSSSQGQALTNLMVMATSVARSGNGRMGAFLAGNEHIVTDMEIPLLRRTNVLEHLAVLKELNGAGYEDVASATFATFDELTNAVKKRQWETLADEFGLTWNEESEASIGKIHGRWGNFRALMGLLSNLKKSGPSYASETAQLKEVFAHVVAGDYRAWRNGQVGERTAGVAIDYLDDAPDFWRAWSAEDATVYEGITVEPAMQRHVLGEEYEHLLRLVQLTGDEEYRGAFQSFAAADENERMAMMEKMAADQKRLSDDRSPDLASVTTRLMWFKVLSTLSSWAEGMNDTQLKINQVINFLRQRLLNLLDSTNETDQELHAQINRLIHFLRASGKERTYEDVRIYDTDDPNMILKMGAVAPDMTNCFNYHGDPKHTHVLTGALGSRNFRLVIVEVDGKIRAVAPAKIRKTEDERPVIFLERGLFSGRYNFEREMLEHLEQKKARRMDQKPIVARQIMKPRPEDVTVYSTGSYSKNEYAEALFGVRESDVVYHSARVVFDPSQ